MYHFIIQHSKWPYWFDWFSATFVAYRCLFL